MALSEARAPHGIPHEVKLYPEAAHSFFSDTSRHYQPEAAADSWARTLEFLSQYLSGGAA